MDKGINVLFAEDMKQKYGHSAWFLRVHGVAMGGYGKPRRWHQDVVERYLNGLATAEERRREEAKKRAAAQEQWLKDRISAVQNKAVTQINPGGMKGQGGRGKKGVAA